MDAQNIGVFLQKQRKQNSLTQKDISKLCNVSTQAVSKWERGESVPDIEILERLSILYKISINELINGEKDELFLDIEKRRMIIALTSSILIFMAYLFNFLKVPISLGGQLIILNGYEVIFDGVGGFQIVISWIVFMILISHLILNIFTITKVVERSKNVLNYFFFTATIGIVISIISLSNEDFIVFPQLILMTGFFTVIFMTYDGQLKFTACKSFLSKKKDQVIRYQLELKEYKKLKQTNGDISEYLTKTKDDSVYMLIINILIIIIALLSIFLAFAYASFIVIDITRGYQASYQIAYIIRILWYSTFAYVLVRLLLLRKTIFMIPAVKQVLITLLLLNLPGLIVIRFGNGPYNFILIILEISLLLVIYLYQKKIK